MGQGKEWVKEKNGSRKRMGQGKEWVKEKNGSRKRMGQGKEYFSVSVFLNCICSLKSVKVALRV
jgi:hypothetical protein